MAAKRKKKIWFGYLDAGARSSPVVRDPSLDTGRATTIYLFNLMKGRIIEYQREIVEAKLRDLALEETSMLGELERQFAAAKESFTPRSQGRPNVSRGNRPRRKKAISFYLSEADDDLMVAPSLDGDLAEIETVEEFS